MGVEWPPTEDELPCDDGMPMEASSCLANATTDGPLHAYLAGRRDVFVGENMFVYFSLEQVRNQDFRGPDFFVALDVPKRDRKSWVVWQEGKGPDVVIELLSDSTAARDKGEKKDVYQNCLRVPEYFWFDPYTAEWAGFVLRDGRYEPIEVDAQAQLISQQLGLALVRWEGIYQEESARWLRWATLDGTLLPTPQEVAEAAQRHAEEVERLATEVQQQAAAAQQQAAAAQQRAAAAQQRATELEALLTRYRERFGDVPE